LFNKIRHTKWFIPILSILLVCLMVGGVMAVAYTLNKTIPSTVTVTEPPTYNLTVNAGSGGSATGGVTGVAAGTTSIITATANDGYHFTSWSGDYTGTANPYTVTINSDMTITANFEADPATAADLYTDLACTISVTSLDFGSVLTTGSPVTMITYFKSNKLPTGGDFAAGQINPATVSVTSNINPAVATLLAIVGTPFGAEIGGNHPCMLTLTVSPVGAGTSSFDIHVTGTN